MVRFSHRYRIKQLWQRRKVRPPLRGRLPVQRWRWLCVPCCWHWPSWYSILMSSSFSPPTSLTSSETMALEKIAMAFNHLLRLHFCSSLAATFLLILSGPASSRYALHLNVVSFHKISYIFVLDWWNPQNGDQAKFSIYIHSQPGFVYDKSTTKSPFFYGRQLNNSIQVLLLDFLFFFLNVLGSILWPSNVQVLWGDSTMIEAERLLFGAALADPANQRFVLLSDRFVSIFMFRCSKVRNCSLII